LIKLPTITISCASKAACSKAASWIRRVQSFIANAEQAGVAGEVAGDDQRTGDPVERNHSKAGRANGPLLLESLRKAKASNKIFDW
jgi:hypothetical protein